MSDASKTNLDAPDPPRKQRLIEMTLILAATLGLDLWSKAWAWENLKEGQSVTVIENWVYFEFGFNTGSAFSFLRDASYARMTFIAVTILAVLYMGKLAATLPTRYRSAFVAIALVSGGALGNLHDRLVRIMELRGEMRYGVVDFIKVFYWKGKVWPTFNVADVALVVGVGLLFIFLTRHGDAIDGKKDAAKGSKPKAKKAKPAADEAPAKANADDKAPTDAPEPEADSGDEPAASPDESPRAES